MDDRIASNLLEGRLHGDVSELVNTLNNIPVSLAKIRCLRPMEWLNDEARHTAHARCMPHAARTRGTC